MSEEIKYTKEELALADHYMSTGHELAKDVKKEIEKVVDNKSIETKKE